MDAVADHRDDNKMLAADDAGIAAAADALARGALVVLPTETVYGLAADATDGAAVAAIFATKDRPRFNPLICHVSDLAMAKRLARFNGLAQQLAEAFWPGPLTLVLPLAAESPVHPLATAGLQTVAVRMPSGIAGRVIERLGRPVAAPSANRSGKISPTTAKAAQDSLGPRAPMIIDAGPASVGLESTIISVGHDGKPICLRPGGLALSDIEAVVGHPVARAAANGPIAAPGMLRSHYAPNAPMRLNVTEVRPGEALLAFGPKPVNGAENAILAHNLSPTGDLAEAAANLFTTLAALDAASPSAIAAMAVPKEGLGEAINDRLARAAAPRPAG